MVFVRMKFKIVELNELELASFQKFLDDSEGEVRRKRINAQSSLESDKRNPASCSTVCFSRKHVD